MFDTTSEDVRGWALRAADEGARQDLLNAVTLATPQEAPVDPPVDAVSTILGLAIAHLVSDGSELFTEGAAQAVADGLFDQGAIQDPEKCAKWLYSVKELL